MSIEHLSVSQIEKFNVAADGGCELRWYYVSILKRKEPQRAFNTVGIKAHAQLKHFLATGEDVLGKIAGAGRHLLPFPGPEMRLEWGLNDKPQPEKDGVALNFFPPKESLVRVRNIPLIGFVDVIDPRPDHVLPDGSTIYEPETVEVVDHKTTKHFKWSKAADELIETTQMPGYGKFVAAKFPWATHVRLSHINYLTEGEPEARKESVRVTIAEINEVWEKRVGAIAERMVEVSAAKTEHDVEGNLSACNAYGGCPHRDYCVVFKAQTPSSRLSMSLKQESKSMSLLNKVRSVTGSPTVPPTPLTNGAPPPQIFAQQASAPLQGNPPWVTTANQAVQGQQYVLPNGVVATFLVAFDQGGALGYSFAPVAGGPPVNLGANDPINASTGTAPAVKERKLQIPVAPVPAAPVAAAPVPVAPAPVHPAPVPQVPRAPVAAAPTPAAAPEPKKGRGPGKKQLEARNAEESGTTDVVTELQDAIEASKVIFCQAFGVQPTPEQALPIWQALLGR